MRSTTHEGMFKEKLFITILNIGGVKIRKKIRLFVVKKINTKNVVIKY